MVERCSSCERLRSQRTFGFLAHSMGAIKHKGYKKKRLWQATNPRTVVMFKCCLTVDTKPWRRAAVCLIILNVDTNLFTATSAKLTDCDSFMNTHTHASASHFTQFSTQPCLQPQLCCSSGCFRAVLSYCFH